MQTPCRLATWIVGVATLLTAACGGGGGGGNNQTAGIDRGGIIAKGAITGFGSVHVNGVRYVTTSTTSYLMDGQPGTEADLQPGQVVRIEGQLDAGGTTGTATRIVFDDEVEGPVQSIDLANASLVVLGRTVRVGAATSFDGTFVPRSLDGVVVGDRVEVSGFVAADGAVDATRIERKTGTSTDEVKGVIANLDSTARHFALGALTVAYATAQLDGFSAGQPANGDDVEVTGTLDGQGVLQATRIEKRGASAGATNDDADFEGLIDRFVSATDFSVNGQRVTANATTTYEDGNAGALGADVYVEVEGSFDANGVIVASQVKFRHQGDLELAARVDSIDLASSRLVVLGVSIRVDSLTRFEDQSGADVQQFSLANLAVGDYVEVRAYDDGSGYLATRLERDDPQGSGGGGDVDLEGHITSPAAPGFVVNGVAITTDANTEFKDNNGVVIDSTAFFQAAVSGPLVRVRGVLVGNVVLATRAELED